MIKLFQKISDFFDKGSVVAKLLYWGLPAITFTSGLTIAMLAKQPLWSIIPFGIFVLFMVVGIVLNLTGKIK